MVSINFKLSDIGRVEVPLEGEEPLCRVLEKAVPLAGGDPVALSLQGLMVIRRGRVLRGDDLVRDEDELELFPAISGG